MNGRRSSRRSACWECSGNVGLLAAVPQPAATPDQPKGAAMGRRQEPGFVEVIVGNSYGARDSDLADAARRWWKIDQYKRHDLEFILAREHWRDEPLAVFRITGSTVVASGRVELTVTEATADEERDVLRAVAGNGVHYGALRYART